MYTETVSSQYIFYAPHHNSHFAWRTQVKKNKPVCICECVCVCVCVRPEQNFPVKKKNTFV